MQKKVQRETEQHRTMEQSSAAALLVRLYLNAGKWIRQKCMPSVKPLRNEFLTVNMALFAGKTWDAVYDWDNENCPRFFCLPSAKGYSTTFIPGSVLVDGPCRTIANYLGDTKAGNGDHNCKYGLAPSFSPDGKPYTTELGRPVAKFKKYPGDFRLKLYRNLGESTREGMMLFGYLDYVENGVSKRVVSPTGDYDLYLRDAVGNFKGCGPDEIPKDVTSDMFHGDHSSGWRFVKYPLIRIQMKAKWNPIMWRSGWPK